MPEMDAIVYVPNTVMFLLEDKHWGGDNPLCCVNQPQRAAVRSEVAGANLNVEIRYDS